MSRFKNVFGITICFLFCTFRWGKAFGGGGGGYTAVEGICDGTMVKRGVH